MHHFLDKQKDLLNDVLLVVVNDGLKLVVPALSSLRQVVEDGGHRATVGD